MLDTGSHGLVFYQRCLKKRKIRPKVIRKEQVQNKQRRFKQKEVLFEEVTMGSGYWRQTKGAVLDAPRPKQFRIDGFLGPVGLDISKISFDLGKQLISWEVVVTS